MTCNSGCTLGSCKSTYKCRGPKNSNCTFAPRIVNLDSGLIPRGAFNIVRNRRKNQLVAYAQNHPRLLNSTYNFMQAAKFSYNLCGRNKTGCCYKMRWLTQSGQKRVPFNDMVDLYRYMIRYSGSSNLAWYTTVVLRAFQNMNLARKMIGDSKYYPYQNIVRNRSGVNRRDCCAFNKLNYNNYRRLRQNEYFQWFKEGGFFDPKLRRAI